MENKDLRNVGIGLLIITSSILLFTTKKKLQKPELVSGLSKQ